MKSLAEKAEHYAQVLETLLKEKMEQKHYYFDPKDKHCVLRHLKRELRGLH